MMFSQTHLTRGIAPLFLDENRQILTGDFRQITIGDDINHIIDMAISAKNKMFNTSIKF